MKIFFQNLLIKYSLTFEKYFFIKCFLHILLYDSKIFSKALGSESKSFSKFLSIMNFYTFFRELKTHLFVFRAKKIANHNIRSIVTR